MSTQSIGIGITARPRTGSVKLVGHEVVAVSNRNGAASMGLVDAGGHSIAEGRVSRLPLV